MFTAVWGVAIVCFIGCETAVSLLLLALDIKPPSRTGRRRRRFGVGTTDWGRERIL